MLASLNLGSIRGFLMPLYHRAGVRATLHNPNNVTERNIKDLTNNKTPETKNRSKPDDAHFKSKSKKNILKPKLCFQVFLAVI